MISAGSMPTRFLATVAAALLAGLGAVGCGGPGAAQHPLTNTLDPGFRTAGITTLAALPFASDISDADDPDRLAAGMVAGKFYQALNAGSGYAITPASESQRMLEQAKLDGALQSFYKDWLNDQEGDAEFIRKVAAELKTDAVVVGAVDVWQQQPVDITETGSARTTVGALVGLYHGTTGKRLWLGRDENFKEGVRHTGQDQDKETEASTTRAHMDRTNLRTATGVYAPPDFATVVDIIVASLVQAFPPRVK